MADLNIPNLDKLIAHLEAQPPEAIHMYWAFFGKHGYDSECGCIMAHSELCFGEMMLDVSLGLDEAAAGQLACPPGWNREDRAQRRYPKSRVLRTLYTLRETGCVDWGPEPTEGQPWAAPQAVELTPPDLPAEITRFLAAEREEVTHG